MGIAYNPRIITDGLVLCLDAGNTKSYPTTGTTWTDLSGNGNTGTLQGAGYNSANGGSISFDGTDDRVTITNPLLSPQGNWSISSWFNLSALPVPVTNDTFNLFSQYIAVANNGRLCLFVRNDGTVVNKFEIFIGSNTGYANQRIIGTTTAQTNTFYNLVATKNGNSFNLYVNGNLEASQEFSGITVLQSTPEIGGCISGNFGWLNGRILSTQIYNRALSAADISAKEIRQNYNALRGRYGI